MCDQEIVRIASPQVECKDTTGAGDLYASGFLLGYANDLPLNKCSLMGSFLAARVTGNIVARIPEEKWTRNSNNLTSKLNLLYINLFSHKLISRCPDPLINLQEG